MAGLLPTVAPAKAEVQPCFVRGQTTAATEPLYAHASSFSLSFFRLFLRGRIGAMSSGLGR